MYIRKYIPDDCLSIIDLFYNTVHTINAKDYSEKQLDAWAPKNIDIEKWNQSFMNHNTVVVLDNEMIVGFGDIDSTGYLDRLYVHKDYQGCGIASMICNELENDLYKKIVTHASVTAVPFFEKRGYHILKKQEVYRQGISLTNYVMKKDMHK